MLLGSLLVLKSYSPMPPVVKNKGIFVDKKISMSYLACLDRLISVIRVLKSSPYLHFWTLMKSATKISVFDYMKKYLLA